uniref:Uncharacterized protein n=1 Tax=Sphaerodactylus townsendi TaxID=933632 RepID=A0ACB8EF99_9SAUR
MENLIVDLEVNMSVEERAGVLPLLVKEEENLEAFRLCSEMEGSKAPKIVHVGSIGELKAISTPYIKMEPEEGEQQLWEVQWQEFLGSLQPLQSGCGTPLISEESAPWDDAKAFLASFEQVARACRWPQEKWVTFLLPALSGEAEQAFSSLSVRDIEDYGKKEVVRLKEEAPDSWEGVAVTPVEGDEIPPPDTWIDVDATSDWDGPEKSTGADEVLGSQMDNIHQTDSEQVAPDEELPKTDSPNPCCKEGTEFGSQEGPEGEQRPEPGKSMDAPILIGEGEVMSLPGNDVMMSLPGEDPEVMSPCGVKL